MKKIILIGIISILLILYTIEIQSFIINDISINSTASGININIFGNSTFNNISINNNIYLDTYLDYYVVNLSNMSIGFPTYTWVNITFLESKNYIFTDMLNMTEGLVGLRSGDGNLITSNVNFSNLTTNYTKHIDSEIINNFNSSISVVVDSCYFIDEMKFYTNNSDYDKVYISNEYSCDNSTKTLDLNVSEIEFGSSKLLLDSLVPNITTDSPINNTLYTVSSIDINGTVTDNVLINTIWYNIANSSNDLLVTNASGEICGETFCDYNFSQIAFPIADELKLNVYANDTNGNQAVLQVNLTVLNDTSSPSITITNPTATTYSSYSININLTITDNVAVDSCEWNITTNLGAIANQSGLLTSCSSIDLTETLGIQSESVTYTLSVQSNDSSNNWGSGSVDFDVDITESPPSAGGGGGTTTAVVNPLGESCTVNSDCESALCDLEENNKGEHSDSYQTCVSTLCGNGICGKEETLTCSDCQAFGGIQNLTTFLKVTGIIGLGALSIVIYNDIVKKKKREFKKS